MPTEPVDISDFLPPLVPEETVRYRWPTHVGYGHGVRPAQLTRLDRAEFWCMCGVGSDELYILHPAHRPPLTFCPGDDVVVTIDYIVDGDLVTEHNAHVVGVGYEGVRVYLHTNEVTVDVNPEDVRLV